MNALEAILNQNDGDMQLSDKQRNYPSAIPPTATPTLTQQGTSAVQPAAKAAEEEAYTPGGFYTKFFMENSPYKAPTQEEIDAERKKMKRDKVLASIGDAMNAFHQAYSYSRGIKPMTENVSQSAKVRDYYDKIDKERKAEQAQYVNAYLRAMQMDKEASDKERSWKRQLDLDKQAKEERDRNFNYKVEQDKKEEARREREKQEAAEKWQKEFEMREKQYGRQNALAWANHSLHVQQQKDNKELREKQIAATGAKAVRGKQLAFSDGNGNSVSIYENVWKGSMEQVYDAIVADFEEQRKNNSNANVPRALSRKATAQQKDDFVKQHWHKSAAGRQMMQTLAGIDPANMTSTTATDGGGLGWGSDDENSNQETDW